MSKGYEDCIDLSKEINDKIEQFAGSHWIFTQDEWEDKVKSIKSSAIEEVEKLIRIKLVDYLCLKDATKYGNRNADQQANSYSTVLKYEVASCVDDLLDDLEKLKGGAENGV